MNVGIRRCRLSAPLSWRTAAAGRLQPAPLPCPAELPSWLPPWGAADKRQTSVDGRCVQFTGLPAAPGYADAVLCGSDSPFSPVLAAALGGGLSPGCEPCVYSPVDNGAYRFDYDNRCWWAPACRYLL